MFGFIVIVVDKLLSIPSTHWVFEETQDLRLRNHLFFYLLILTIRFDCLNDRDDAIGVKATNTSAANAPKIHISQCSLHARFLGFFFY